MDLSRARRSDDAFVPHGTGIYTGRLARREVAASRNALTLDVEEPCGLEIGGEEPHEGAQEQESFQRWFPFQKSLDLPHRGGLRTCKLYAPAGDAGRGSRKASLASIVDRRVRSVDARVPGTRLTKLTAYQTPRSRPGSRESKVTTSTAIVVAAPRISPGP